MDFTFNTKIVDVSVALRALDLYRTKEYKDAVPVLLQVLDAEPDNQQARLMLGACYYKIADYCSAQRCFWFISEKTGDVDLKRKSLDGLQACDARMNKTFEIPPEFGCHVDRISALRVSWLDEAPVQPRSNAPKVTNRWIMR